MCSVMNEKAAQLSNMAEVRSPINSISWGNEEFDKMFILFTTYAIALCVLYVTEEFCALLR